jgi:hypothetical protein
MPAGPAPLGLAYFVGIKAAGYTAASVILKHGYGLRDSAKPTVWSVGLTRTAIGIAAGLLYGAFWIYGLRNVTDTHGIRYLSGLLPIRLAEWSLLIWIFFDRGLHDGARLWKYVIFGTTCSYVLDAMGVGAALVLPGGIWVC